MKIAVTGGTGFIGKHLVKRLQSDGHDLTLLVHRRPSGQRPGNIALVTGALDDTASLRQAFAGAEVVYHLVGIIAETKDQTFQKTVVEGTKNVAEACLAAGVKKIVFLSAMGTSENAPTKYHRTKYQAEQAVISSGLDHIIYRPSVVYGEGDGFVSMLTKMIRMIPVTPVVGSGRYLLQPVYIDDLAEVMARGLTTEAAWGNIIEVGGPEKLEYVRIVDLIKRVLGKRRVNLHIPIGVMKTIAGVLERLVTPAPLTRDQLLMMEMGNTGDTTKMKELFAIDPIKMEDGLEKYLR